MAKDIYGNEIPEPLPLGVRAARRLKEEVGKALFEPNLGPRAPSQLGALIRPVKAFTADFAGEYWPSQIAPPAASGVPPAPGWNSGADLPVGVPAVAAGADAEAATTRARQLAMRTVADPALRSIDSFVRPGGVDPGSARIRAIRDNPQALAAFNQAQDVNATGVTASRDARGGLVIGGAGNQVKRYIGADGKPTARWEDTEEFQSATARAAKDKATLANIEAKKELEQAKHDMRVARNPRRLAAATAAYTKLLDAQFEKDKLAATLGLSGEELQRKALHDQLDFMIRSQTGAAAARRDTAAAGVNEMALAAAERARARGASEEEVAAIAMGRAPTRDVFTGFPTMDGKIDVLNRAKGAVTRVTPSEVAKLGFLNGKYYVLDPAGKPVREATPAEQAQLSKKP